MVMSSHRFEHADCYITKSDDLAIFHYILNMKVERNKNPFIFLATYWNLSYKSGDLKEKKIFEIWQIWAFFFMNKSFV
jgi:hypothetical protein